ncbi:MAG: glycosyltransferase [Chthoniobacteraceae bacterium]
MRILLTNIALKGFSGTETALRDIVLGLLRAGHQVMVYSPLLGPIGQELADAGAFVSDRIDCFSEAPDIIHGQHHIETLTALAQFPHTPAIFVIHDTRAWHDIPPLVPQIKHYVGVSRYGLNRLERYGLKKEVMHLIPNTFDAERFPQRDHVRERPARALFFCSYARAHAALAPLQAACLQEGIELDVVGKGLDRLETHPEDILSEYDLVFGTGRCALEALATGASVILYGNEGLGPMLTRANIDELRQCNLGLHLLTLPLELESIAAEIRKYDATEALCLSDYIRENASIDSAISQYLAVYQEAMEETVDATADPMTESLRAMAIHTARFEAWCFQEISTRPLPPNIGRQLFLKILKCPETVSGNFTAEVEVENCSDQMLISALPYPIQFSYHWYRRDRCVVFDGLRTQINKAILPGEKRRIYVPIAPPPSAGRYLLRLTIVQEGLYWLDKLDPPVGVELQITHEPLARERPQKRFHRLLGAARKAWTSLTAQSG